MADIPDQEAWDAWHPAEMARRLAGVDRPWCVVGGWALDLWHGQVTREHHDLEFTVLRGDFDHFRRVLADSKKDPLWPAGHLPHKGGDDSRRLPASIEAQAVQQVSPPPCGEGLGGVLGSDDGRVSFAFYTVNSGLFEHLPEGSSPDPSIGQIWCWDTTASRWRVDMMIEPGTPDTWVCKRDHTITLPRAEAVLNSADGIPYLAPAVILLLKAKHQRPKDEMDFEAALPKLTKTERTWLKTSLAKLHPDHAWTERL